MVPGFPSDRAPHSGFSIAASRRLDQTSGHHEAAPPASRADQRFRSSASAHDPAARARRLRMGVSGRDARQAASKAWRQKVGTGFWQWPCGNKRHIKRFWEDVRAKAELPAVRIHDLRHTFASLLVSGGMTLPMIGKLLGHTQVQTTQRYAHLLDDPLRAGLEQVGNLLRAVSCIVAD